MFIPLAFLRAGSLQTALVCTTLLCFVSVLHRWTPPQAELSVTPWGSHRELLLEAAVGVWVFLQKMNPPDSEQASRAGGTREGTGAGPERCVIVHYSDALQVIPKHSTHLHLSCSKPAQAPLPGVCWATMGCQVLAGAVQCPWMADQPGPGRPHGDGPCFSCDVIKLMHRSIPLLFWGCVFSSRIFPNKDIIFHH